MKNLEAEKLPLFALEGIFMNLSLNDLYSIMCTSRRLFYVVEMYTDSVWKAKAQHILPPSALNDVNLLKDIKSYKDKIRAFKFSWNQIDTSKNIYLKPNGFTVHRQPVAQSTDAIRGKMGVNAGIHAWQFTWIGPLGTVAMIGIATKHATLHCHGYKELLGNDDQSWGWNLVTGNLQHNGEVICSFPKTNNAPRYKIGEKIRMVLDCEKGILYFEKGSEFLGVAFEDIPPLKLFPAISAVYGNTEVTMTYVGPPVVG
uniref:F-box/SPRY domain-containing protein 1 n=1 Tax=Rhabditophanes sp. KR3021 TaxID=114890 RepID=A0AC35TNJ6_9BILA